MATVYLTKKTLTSKDIVYHLLLEHGYSEINQFRMACVMEGLFNNKQVIPHLTGNLSQEKERYTKIFLEQVDKASKYLLDQTLTSQQKTKFLEALAALKLQAL